MIKDYSTKKHLCQEQKRTFSKNVKKKFVFGLINILCNNSVVFALLLNCAENIKDLPKILQFSCQITDKTIDEGIKFFILRFFEKH